MIIDVNRPTDGPTIALFIQRLQLLDSIATTRSRPPMLRVVCVCVFLKGNGSNKRIKRMDQQATGSWLASQISLEIFNIYKRSPPEERIDLLVLIPHFHSQRPALFSFKHYFYIDKFLRERGIVSTRFSHRPIGRSSAYGADGSATTKEVYSLECHSIRHSSSPYIFSWYLWPHPTRPQCLFW